MEIEMEMKALEGVVVFPEDPIDAIHGLLAHVDADSVSLREHVGQQRYDMYRDL